MTVKIAKVLILYLIIFSGGIALISFLYMDSILLTLILLLCLLTCFMRWHNKRDLYSFIIGMIVGTSAEIITVHFGVWRYTNPTLLKIPLWLPLAWGTGAIVIRRLSETLSEI
jgi:uncharacterized membrane protein YoaT (DUF817 family)